MRPSVYKSGLSTAAIALDIYVFPHLAPVRHAAGHRVQPGQHFANVDARLKPRAAKHRGGGHLTVAHGDRHRHLLTQLMGQQLLFPENMAGTVVRPKDTWMDNGKKTFCAKR